MTVLFVNELGGGYGNVGPLVRLAQRLAPFGIKPLFALADTVTPAWLLAGLNAPVLPAPVHPRPLHAKAGPATYGDMLACHGFASVAELRALVQAWDGLFALVKPKLIVASHAPTAVLAAHGRYPVAIVGTGFTAPPASIPIFPALRPDTASFRPEFQVLETVNTVLAGRGEAALAALPRLFAVGARLIETNALLDPYAVVREEPYVTLSPAAEKPAPIRADAGLFATLDMRGKEAAATVEALGLLAEGLPVEAHLRGPGAAAALRFLARRGAIAHDTPAPMPQTLERVRVVISQGGHGLSLAAAYAGRPQVVLPQHFEAMLNGVALEREGAGKVAWGGARDTVLAHIDWALAEGALGAARLAERLEPQPAFDPEGFLVAFGFKPQRRKSPSSAKPKRGQRSQGSLGGSVPGGAKRSVPAANPAA